MGQTSCGLTTRRGSSRGRVQMWHGRQSRSRASTTRASETASCCKDMEYHNLGGKEPELRVRLASTYRLGSGDGLVGLAYYPTAQPPHVW